MSDGAENGGETSQNGTIHHVFRHFDVGRSADHPAISKDSRSTGNDEERQVGNDEESLSMINCGIFHNFLYIWELGDSRSSRE